jgi:hypothetical protein
MAGEWRIRHLREKRVVTSRLRIAFHVDHPGSPPNLASPGIHGSPLYNPPCCSVCARGYVEPSEQVHEELLDHGACAFTV